MSLYNNNKQPTNKINVKVYRINRKIQGTVNWGKLLFSACALDKSPILIPLFLRKKKKKIYIYIYIYILNIQDVQL